MITSVFDDIKNAFRNKDNALNQLILIHVIVFLIFIICEVLMTLMGFKGVYESVLYYFKLEGNFMGLLWKPWTIFTYAFLHQGFFHILFNMMFLYWFGMIISEFIGSKKLIKVYILGILAGGLAYLTAYATIPYFETRASFSTLVGASGGVFAVVFAAATLVPNYTLHLMFLGPVRIIYIALFYFVLSFAETIGPNAGGNIAHLGGALMGYFYIQQLRSGRDLGTPIQWFFDLFTKIKAPKSKMKVTYGSPKQSVFTGSEDHPSQYEIDIILEKISKLGYEKLSKEEKQKLFKASQK